MNSARTFTPSRRSISRSIVGFCGRLRMPCPPQVLEGVISRCWIRRVMYAGLILAFVLRSGKPRVRSRAICRIGPSQRRCFEISGEISQIGQCYSWNQFEMSSSHQQRSLRMLRTSAQFYHNIQYKIVCVIVAAKIRVYAISLHQCCYEMNDECT